ncbi:putative ubiquitin-specific protease UBP12 [Aspergillus undulatus]|uniref:putative ubiquitin-specific protease UBP12 n=1 Tax=Aspergillus undulatus TaxID=1810928 RepID=UPI003CCD41B9
MSSSEKKDDVVPPTGRDARSASPAKRAAPEAEQDVEMSSGPGAKDSQPQPANPDQMDTTGSEDGSSGNDGNSASDNAYQTPSSMSTYTAPVAGTQETTKTEASVSPEERPSYDDQVARVTCFMMQPLKEGQKGYVVSMSWLKRVLARSSTHADKMDKTALEGEIGQVDNSDLVLVTDPVNTGFKDERNGPFIPLRPGLQMGEDFEVIPQEGWDLIIQWYGLAEQSPAIVRYAHNTVPSGDSENIQYEINPPIYTLLKLSNPQGGVTPASLREKNKPPVKTLASRHTNFQTWLGRAKELVNVDTSCKVRVWRILGGLGSAAGSAAITPAASRSNSPAPFSPLVSNVGNSCNLDLNTFLSLSEGTQRESLSVKDQSANANYNGKMTLDLAGLGDGGVVVLEESVPISGSNTEWVSDLSSKTLSRLGVPTGNLKTNKKNKSPTASGRSSPAPETVRKTRKDGKPRGNTGLSNLGNTCYMNSALQCVRSVEELTYYFLNDVYKKDLNPSNPLAHNGDVAKAYANLLRTMYDPAGQSSFAPRGLKNTIGRYGPAFSGYGQQDSQEFLLFLLDGLQEDLNRIQKKPYIEKPDSTDEMVHDRKALEEFADQCWDIYKARNDSVVTDLFAGMYKSTLVCPTCEKVSIIFDPFNNLTLQLPIENLWSKSIYFFPFQKKPIIIDVEIDKNSSVKALKELVAKKTDTNPERLVMSEIYKNKFYKMFDNTSSMAECQIGDGDEIGVFEVESAPTNYNPDKPTRSSYFSYGRSSYEEVPSFDSPKADRMIISVFNRHHRQTAYRKQREFFGVPSYVIINREEATDYDAILRKILAEVATMTTKDFLNEKVVEEQQETEEDSDTVVMNEDDAESADSKIKTASVDGEEGMVDVSMRDADQGDITEDSTPQLESSVPARFHSLFDIKIARTNEAVPLGFSSVDENKEYNSMTSRIQKKPTVKEEKSDSDESSEEKDDKESDDGIDVLGNTRTTTPKPKAQRPLINPGEAIVLDWPDESYEALFSGDHRDPNGPRGAPTWTNIERMPDPELTSRRQLRKQRKKKGVTLNECLDEFNKEEILSENDAWYCPRCKEHRRASKKFELWKTPDILVMHLKRFSASRGFRDKLDIMVDFPVEGLDLTGRVEAPEEDKSLIYDLFAVDNHYGGLGGGHYTAYAKNFMTGQWNEYNDSSVSRPIDPQNAVTSSAYLLFYRRRSDRPLGGKILEEITESSTRPGSESDSQGESRPPSPSGEGRRLGGSSRNGSSSALAGVGAAHQLGDGGLRIGTAKSRNDDGGDENLPDYSNSPAYGERSFGTGMDINFNYDDDGDGDYGSLNPFHNSSTWSFSRIPDTSHSHAHGLSQINATELPGSLLDDDHDDALNINLDGDEDAADDNDSNKAVGGGNVSDSDYRMAELADSPPFEGSVNPCPGTPLELDIDNDHTTDLTDLPPLVDVDDDVDTNVNVKNVYADVDPDDDELPIVELRVDGEERLD